MFGTHFYHATMRKSVAVFGTLFNDISVVRKKADGSIVEVSVRQGGKGETIYDQKMADILFNISTSK